MNYLQLPIKAGIYKILNIVNNKCYIGSAINLRRRAYEHFSSLRRGVHFNKHLQRSWNKYGESNFQYHILEECDKDQLIIKETLYLQKMESYLPKKGYNMENHPVSTWLGRKHTPETKAKIRLARSKQIISPETRKKISLSLKGKRPNFSPEFISRSSERLRMMDRSFTQTEEFRKKIGTISRNRAIQNGRKFVCHQNKKTYSNCGEASRDLGFNYKLIWRVLTGERKQTHGFTFEYLSSL